VGDRGVDETACLPDCGCGAGAAHLQQPIVGVVLDGQQPFEVAGHHLAVRRDLRDEADCVTVVLSS